jgi:hypothetical protein
MVPAPYPPLLGSMSDSYAGGSAKPSADRPHRRRGVNEDANYPLYFDRPAIYRIRVYGYLDKDWSDQLGGLDISTGAAYGETPTTTLYGRLADQVALVSVIDDIHTYHRLPLLSVEYVGEDSDTD